MIDAGVEAIITCVDPKKLPRSFAGRRFDHALLEELPEGVDPCGENGEFHTCVLVGSMFREPLRAVVGEVVERDGFCFADLVLRPPMVEPQEAANNSMQRAALRAAADAER
jgi:diphthamide synthase (EF-2-diphthine--ammonia ligase)